MVMTSPPSSMTSPTSLSFTPTTFCPLTSSRWWAVNKPFLKILYVHNFAFSHLFFGVSLSKKPSSWRVGGYWSDPPILELEPYVAARILKFKEQFRKKCHFYRITIPCEEWGFFQKVDPWQPSQCCSPAPSASDRAPSNISHMIWIHFQICKSKILPWFKTNKLWEKKPSQRKTQQGWLRPSGEAGHQTCADPPHQLFFLSGNQQLCFWYF